MRNFSILSILIALAAVALLWNNLLVKSTPDRLPDPAAYTTPEVIQSEQEIETEDCNETEQAAAECDTGLDSAEQGEMEQQRGQGHDVMMDSFNKKYDKYKDQVNGR
jgi:hypothetical protein